jgi:hypothetical protein
MYKETSQKWDKNIYKNVKSAINIYFDGVLINPKYITDFKPGNTLFDEDLELGATPSQYIELQVHKQANVQIPKIIKVEYGILINNALTVEEVNSMLLGDLSGIKMQSLSTNDSSFEMIPIGIYNVDDYSDDDNVLTIKALDNMIKLDSDDGYYDASSFINEKGGSVTLGELAQDICEKKGVELRFYFFLKFRQRDICI